MCKLPQRRFVGIAIAMICLVWAIHVEFASSQPPPVAAAPEPAPPAGQTYTGSKQCSSCHFKQYTSWKKTKHAIDAWTKVAAKDRAKPECLACHTTGYGQPTGYKGASTPALVGTSCEACHGPGSKHEEVCQPLAKLKKLTPEQEKQARDSIYKVLPGNVCAQCHLAPSHKEHPKY